MLVVSHARRIFTHRLRIHRLHRIRKFHPNLPRHRSRRQASNLLAFFYNFCLMFLVEPSRRSGYWIPPTGPTIFGVHRFCFIDKERQRIRHRQRRVFLLKKEKLLLCFNNKLLLKEIGSFNAVSRRLRLTATVVDTATRSLKADCRRFQKKLVIE